MHDASDAATVKGADPGERVATRDEELFHTGSLVRLRPFTNQGASPLATQRRER